MKSLARHALIAAFVVSATLVGCDRGGDTTEEEVPVVTETEGAPVDVAPTDAEPAASTTDRTGPWIDTLVVVEEPNADAAVTRLEAGDLDIYAYTIASPSTFERIQSSDSLNYKSSYGSFNEITFNPSACTDATKLNPFQSPRIREAMNWLIDRDYIVAEIMGGLGTPRWVPINGASADRGRLAAEIRAIERAYPYDLERAETAIAEEMATLGAERGEAGWTFQGAPVELIGLIRNEDERTQIGDYVAQQLENVGFTVIPDYKSAAEASPIWQAGEPTECLFHYYTGGWVSTSVSRDASDAFSFYYTPAGLPRPLWQAYTPSEEFKAVADRLIESDYSSMEERTALFAQALPLALQDSARIWLLDRSSVAPHRAEVEVASDLSGSIYGTALWPYTLRVTGEEGGSLTWASASILSEVWNPIAGTNWIFDTTLYRSTGQWSFMPDPNTGLNWPHRIESFAVTAREGLPVSESLDWVALDFAPEITVPDDAWADWDATAQRFIPASEAYTETQTAQIKVVGTYPADLFETIKWHDGSPLSMGDMVMSLIMAFDQAKPESAIHDPAQVPAFETFKSTFKGIKIVSTDPVTIEFYSDDWSLDAENAISNFRTLWPYYSYGEAPWSTVGLGVAAEAENLAAFSASKSTENEIEQFNYIAGPTIDILSAQLALSAEAGTIPYAPTMSEYVTAEEAALRYTNLQEWFRRRSHYWVGTGPFFLQRAFPVEGTVILERNPEFPDPSDKWARFAAPAIALVEVDGPGRVAPGDEAAYDVFVTHDGAPYAQADVTEVKYLVFDATGELVDSGAAEAVEDGAWRVTLGADVTGGLEAGSNRLEVIVISNLVALPSLGALEFVTAP